MEIREYASLLYVLCVLDQVSSDSGVSLSLEGRTVPNHGLVYVDDIGETDYNSLKCITDLQDCCEGGNLGHWNYPHYGLVRSKEESGSDVLYASRGSQVIRLHRKNVPAEMVGVFRCEIPTAETYPRVATMYVGIYNYHKGLPEIYNIHVDRVTRAINCFSQGGPVTEFSWVKDGMIIPLQSGSAYSQSKVIIDFGSSNYLISLRITNESDLVGSFKCAVKNIAGSHERTIVIESDFSIRTIKGCGALASIENGRVELSDGFNIGSEVTFTCSQSHKLYDIREVRCLDGGAMGQWSGGKLPACEMKEDCKEGFDTTSGLLVKYTDKFKEFSVASFSCAKTHRMVGSGNPVTCRNGKWDGKPPKCELVLCPLIESIKFGEVVITKNRMVGATATYTCVEPYVLSHATPVRECRTSGAWSGSDMQCVASKKVKADKICSPISTVSDSVVKVVYTNNQALFTCPKEYSLLGLKSAVCDHDTRQWLGNSAPRCVKASGIKVSYNVLSFVSAILWTLTMH